MLKKLVIIKDGKFFGPWKQLCIVTKKDESIVNSLKNMLFGSNYIIW